MSRKIAVNIFGTYMNTKLSYQQYDINFNRYYLYFQKTEYKLET